MFTRKTEFWVWPLSPLLKLDTLWLDQPQQMIRLQPTRSRTRTDKTWHQLITVLYPALPNWEPQEQHHKQYNSRQAHARISDLHLQLNIKKILTSIGQRSHSCYWLGQEEDIGKLSLDVATLHWFVFTIVITIMLIRTQSSLLPILTTQCLMLCVVRKYQVHFQWLASSQTFLMRLYCVIICNIMLITHSRMWSVNVAMLHITS